MTIRSFALVTTGASAIRAKSRAAASGPMSKFPTDTIRRSALTTTGLDWEEFSSSWRMFRGVAERVAGRAVDLREAAEGQRVLEEAGGLGV